MRKPGMIQLDVSHFSNVIGAVQRTSSLTGGAVRGLPGGVVIDGLQGVSSFAASISEAQKEYQLGRTRTSLERIKQLENQFNGLSGSWNSTVMSVISGARQGRQAIPQQKLNEVKNAQTRMQQLMGPVNKSFRDLVTALEHEITMEGYESERGESESCESESEDSMPKTRDNQTPPQECLAELSSTHHFGEKLQLARKETGKTHITPAFKPGEIYFFSGNAPQQLQRLSKVNQKSILVQNPSGSDENEIDGGLLLSLIKRGIWHVCDNQERGE